MKVARIVLALLLTTLLLGALNAAAFQKPDYVPRFGAQQQILPGSWVASGSNDCPQGLVCAEWIVDPQEQTGILCCLKPSQLGGSNLGACDSFRH